MLRVRFTRLLAWVGRKLGLINCLTGAWMFRIKNDTDVSHTLRMEVRSGIGGEYQIITEKGHQTQKIEREWAWIEVELLPGTQSVEILQ